jgi:uncharacterized protein (TIGR02452 family)
MSPLHCLPCEDSDALAEQHRAALDIPRPRAAQLGRSAVYAADQGHYDTDHGAAVDWRQLVEAAVAAKVSVPPDAALPAQAPTRHAVTRVQVVNDTTMAAARRLVDAGHLPLALNFANGIHPGGGFLSGSRAQEEVLCRSSALAHTLWGDPMYDTHRKRPTPDSTDWAILSPRVPFFRLDDGTTLDAPWLLDVLTCAAPVAFRVGQPLAGDLMARRITRVLAIAQAHGYDTLVLGAWGCGAFGNDAHRTARDFRAALEGPFGGVFAEVVFAVTDWSPERRFLGPFREVFQGDALGEPI